MEKDQGKVFQEEGRAVSQGNTQGGRGGQGPC